MVATDRSLPRPGRIHPADKTKSFVPVPCKSLITASNPPHKLPMPDWLTQNNRFSHAKTGTEKPVLIWIIMILHSWFLVIIPVPLPEAGRSLRRLHAPGTIALCFVSSPLSATTAPAIPHANRKNPGLPCFFWRTASSLYPSAPCPGGRTGPDRTVAHNGTS